MTIICFNIKKFSIILRDNELYSFNSYSSPHLNDSITDFENNVIDFNFYNIEFLSKGITHQKLQVQTSIIMNVEKIDSNIYYDHKFIIWNKSELKNEIKHHKKYCLFQNEVREPYNIMIDLYEEDQPNGILGKNEEKENYAINFEYLSRLQSSVLINMYFSETDTIFENDTSTIINSKYVKIKFIIGKIIIYYNTLLYTIVNTIINDVREAIKVETVYTWLEQVWTNDEKDNKKNDSNSIMIIEGYLNSLFLIMKMPSILIIILGNSSNLLLSFEGINYNMLSNISDKIYNKNSINFTEIYLSLIQLKDIDFDLDNTKYIMSISLANINHIKSNV